MEKNNVRTKNPFFTSTLILALTALLLSSGCRTKDVASEPVSQPPTAILPPAAPSNNSTVLNPPPALPDFKLEPIPSTTTKSQPSGISYKVKNGDSLSLIAAKYGVSAREIAELNGISNPNKIRVGQTLSLPAYAKERHYTPKKSTAKASTVKKPAAAAKPVVAAGGEYVVKSGDSISKIAMNHRVKQKDLLAVNNLTSDKLKIGQKLKIPGAGDVVATAPAVEAAPVAAPVTTDPLATPAPTVDPAAVPAPVAPDAGAVPGATPAAPAAPVATVQTFEVSVDPGDTIDSISQKYGVLPDDIKKLNSINEVAPGQRIKLPLPTP